MVRELEENWRQWRLHATPETTANWAREPRATSVWTVIVHLPHPEEVREAILDALEDERRQNRKPRLVLVGMSWWASLEQGYDRDVLPPWMFEGVDLRLDGTMPRGCRVICNMLDEVKRYANKAVKPAEAPTEPEVEG